MTPLEFRRARLDLGLTQKEMAERLRLSDGRRCRGYESGEYDIPGTVSLLMEMFLNDKRKKK